MSLKGERVFGRKTHGWSVYEGHPELGFIDVDWLEVYRERRIGIINRRVEEATARGETLTNDERLGTEEPTILNKSSIDPIQTLMRKHRRWHPFKFPSTMPLLDNGSPLTPRFVWLRQAKEMHDECKKYKEGYAWEYLWDNWYKWDKWQLWARATSMDYYPIIQTNAPVETHWNSLKNINLRHFNNIRLDHLCHEIHHTFLPSMVNRIRQYQRRIKGCSWHKSMVAEWKSIEQKIAEQDEVDMADAELDLIDPDSENSPASQRLLRIREQHHTDLHLWRCQCYDFNHSSYHLCQHLIRLYGQPHPLKREAVRQHAPPLLFVNGLHDESQRFHRPTPEERGHPGPEPPASLEQLGMMDLDFPIEGRDMDEELDYSRHAEKLQKYEAWIEGLEKATAYARQEMARGSREVFDRLPDTTAKGLQSLVRLADNAHTLDNSRRRRTTWGPERHGANRYR